MELAFVLKKLLGSILMPLPLLLVLALVALLFMRSTYRQYALCTGVLVVLCSYLLSTEPVAHALAKPLEFAYPKYQDQPVSYVLVLGGGHRTDSEKPLSSILGGVSLTRLVEGISIYRRNPGSKLLVSGYKGGDTISHARAAWLVAKEMGVPEADIVMAEHVKDTAEEAAHWVNVINKEDFALVSSASHIPRSVFLFEQEIQSHGGDVSTLITAPTAYLSSSTYQFHYLSWVPRGRNFATVEAAWHEYLGRFWAYLRALSN